LEELLDEDELIQECKSLNARLTAFLKQRDTVERLIAYLVEEPPANADAKRQFKYPFSACEIFCCEVEGVFNTLLENDDLLDQLFSILHGLRPLNSMHAGYFARVVGSLLLRRSADVMQYLQRRPDLLAALVSHVDTTSVAEVICRLTGADDNRGYGVATALEWLADTDLLQLLVKQLGPGVPAEAQANAAEVLAAVARSSASPLTRRMASADFMQQLVEAALAPHEDRAATHALNVCIALLDPDTAPTPDPTLGPNQSLNGADDVHERLREEAIRCIASATDRLVLMLDTQHIEELKTSYGVVRPPVGQLRLKAVDLLAALLRTGDHGAEAAVMSTQGVQKAMELFLAHPFNNALHGGVAALLTAFEPGSEALREFLLREARLVDWLVAAPEEVRPEAHPDDEMKELRKPLRAGYCGHLTQIANRLLQLGGKCIVVRDYLESHQEWAKFVSTRLEPRNRVESVFAWRCGRPAAAHGPDLGGDAGLYQADMVYAPLEPGAFNKDVYQRYGMYEGDGEDDDENDELQQGLGVWQLDLPGAADHPEQRDDDDDDEEEEEEDADAAHQFLAENIDNAMRSAKSASEPTTSTMTTANSAAGVLAERFSSALTPLSGEQGHQHGLGTLDVKDENPFGGDHPEGIQTEADLVMVSSPELNDGAGPLHGDQLPLTSSSSGAFNDDDEEEEEEETQAGPTASDTPKNPDSSGGGGGGAGVPGDDVDVQRDRVGMGLDSMADMQDDAVVLIEDDAEAAAEGLMILQTGLQNLRVGDEMDVQQAELGHAESGSVSRTEDGPASAFLPSMPMPAAAAAATTTHPTAESAAAGDSGALVSNTGARKSSQMAAASASGRLQHDASDREGSLGEKKNNNDNEEDTAEDFNAALYWKPTFAVSIDEGA
jgi:serine/threonine-protein phosphatase 6 regulatory subunit 3